MYFKGCLKLSAPKCQNTFVHQHCLWPKGEETCLSSDLFSISRHIFHFELNLNFTFISNKIPRTPLLAKSPYKNGREGMNTERRVKIWAGNSGFRWRDVQRQSTSGISENGTVKHTDPPAVKADRVGVHRMEVVRRNSGIELALPYRTEHMQSKWRKTLSRKTKDKGSVDRGT